MPRKKFDASTTRSEADVAGAVGAFLSREGFERKGPKDKYLWKKGLYWSITASVSVKDGIAHLELWNFAPYPGLGSYIMYFRNRGKLDSIMAGMQASIVSAADGSPTAQPVPISPEPPKKTVSGFAKGWLIFWIVGNIAAVLASIQNVRDSRLAWLGAMVMLISALVAVGYFLLLYKKPFGLYLAIGANLLALVLAGSAMRSGSVTMTTGLIIGVISFFITKSQVEYPFARKKQAHGGTQAAEGK